MVSLSSLFGGAAASPPPLGAAAPEQALVSSAAAAAATSSPCLPAGRRIRVVGGMALLLIGRTLRLGTGWDGCSGSPPGLSWPAIRPRACATRGAWG